MIIFLNGATSSGKTTLAKAIQHLSDQPWLTFGIDAIIEMLPRKYRDKGQQEQEGFYFVEHQDEEGPLLALTLGTLGKKSAYVVAEVVSLLDKKGFNIIIDEVLLGDEMLKHYVETLSDAIVYFIGVHCDKHIIEEREILRGDRFIGSARDQIKRCHGPTRQYDVEVDTTHHSAFECAKKILDFIEKENEPQGFTLLKNTLLIK